MVQKSPEEKPGLKEYVIRLSEIYMKVQYGSIAVKL